MNVKHIAAALSLAVVGSAAMAADYTNFVDPVSTLTRAGRVAIESSKTQAPTAIVVSNNEATQFVDVAATHRDRADVRAEARVAARGNNKVNTLYIGG